MGTMADIQNFHGNSFIGIVVTITLYLIGIVTASNLALIMTILSATIVCLANLPRAISTVKSIIKKVKNDRKAE